MLVINIPYIFNKMMTSHHGVWCLYVCVCVCVSWYSPPKERMCINKICFVLFFFNLTKFKFGGPLQRERRVCVCVSSCITCLLFSKQPPPPPPIHPSHHHPSIIISPCRGPRAGQIQKHLLLLLLFFQTNNKKWGGPPLISSRHCSAHTVRGLWHQ